MKNLTKTIVIGIDSGCWEYIDPLLKEDRLPNIKSLMKNGAAGILKSTIPPLSPVAWSSFITGKKPENHGIFDYWHIKYNPKQNGLGRYFRPVTPKDRKGIPFWKYLNQYGHKVGIVNIPTTYPADKVNGFFISGYDSPEKSPNMVYPKDLYNQLLTKYGQEVFNIPSFDLLKKGEINKFIKLYTQHDKKQTLAAIELAKKYNISTLVINYMMNDHFNHLMKDYSNVEKGLEIIDKNIGLLVKEFPSANFIVISDHGSMRTKGAFLISEWLMKQGLLQFKHKPYKLRRLRVAFHHFFTRFNLRGRLEKYIRNTIVLPLQFLPEALCEKLVNSIAAQNPILYWPWDDIDFSRSIVAMCSPAIGGIYLNTKENGLDDTLSSQEYFKIRETLKKELNKIIHPQIHIPLVTNIYTREEVYNHSFNHAPDLMVFSLFSINTSIRLKDGEKNNFFVSNDEVNYYGIHSEEGIYIFSGSSFNKNFNSILYIWDIPAIILHLNNIPISNDFDTTISEKVFSDQYIKKNPLIYKKQESSFSHQIISSDLSNDEAELVKERLKDLGYM